jgi:uncharacterized protein
MDAPIQADVGPDGQVWVIDWYNYIVQHNPTPAGFETGKRGAYVTPAPRQDARPDLAAGARQAPSAHETSLAGASADGLVAALGDDNMFWRERAQRKLVERAAGRPMAAATWCRRSWSSCEDSTVDGIGLNPASIHAIWTLKALGRDRRRDGRRRSRWRGAVGACASLGGRADERRQGLPRDQGTLGFSPAPTVLDDPAPLVRLAARGARRASAVAGGGGELVTTMLADPRTLADPVLADAATSAAARCRRRRAAGSASAG